MGENHDNSTDPSLQANPRPPQHHQGRCGAGRNGREHESGLCGDGDAVRSNGLSHQVDQSAALGPLPGSRYPDARLESAAPTLSFGPANFPAFAGTMAVERVATGFRWAEGPVYFPAGRYVLFSDIPNNRIMRFSEDDG